MNRIEPARHGWWARWWSRRRCFHHDTRGGDSWITQTIIDYRKLYDCTHCGRRWVV